MVMMVANGLGWDDAEIAKRVEKPKPRDDGGWDEGAADESEEVTGGNGSRQARASSALGWWLRRSRQWWTGARSRPVNACEPNEEKRGERREETRAREKVRRKG